MTSIPIENTTRRKWAEILIPAVILLIVGWMLFSRGMERGLNHDEHQFLAPGVLLSQEGLLPYRDYPLFHLPNLVFAYAALDKLTGQPIFSAKLLSICASIGLVGILVWLIWRHKEIVTRDRVLLAVAVVAVLIFDPIFLFTSGKTWNHEVPTFLIAGALVLQACRFTNPSLVIAVLCGLLGGLAAGCRLTFGPMLIPLCIAAWLVPGSLNLKVRHGLAWGAGAFLGLLPSIWLFLLSPEHFLFGNLEFPRLRLSDPTNLRVQKTILLSSKLRYFVKEIIRASWPIFLLYLVIGVRPGWLWLRGRGGSVVCAFVLTVLPFALLGCFAPSRYQYQHFFGLIGLLALGIAAAFPSRIVSLTRKQFITAVIGIVAASVLAGAVSKKAKHLYPLAPLPPDEWFPFKFRERARKISEYVSGGPVLTLAPAWPIEAGLPIYPEFATGVFGWRSAHLLPAARRDALDMIAPEDLERFLKENPPSAILTGYEDPEHEKPLRDYARQFGYRSVKIEGDRRVWLPPATGE